MNILYEVIAKVNNKYLLVQFNIILYNLIYSTQTDIYNKKGMSICWAVCLPNTTYLAVTITT